MVSRNGGKVLVCFNHRRKNDVADSKIFEERRGNDYGSLGVQDYSLLFFLTCLPEIFGVVFC